MLGIIICFQLLRLDINRGESVRSGGERERERLNRAKPQEMNEALATATASFVEFVDFSDDVDDGRISVIILLPVLRSCVFYLCAICLSCLT